MRKIIIYIAMSLDGYIADKSNNVAWLSGDGSDENNMGSYPEFVESIDTIILGYSTYHQIVTELSPDKWVYDGKKCYVLTHRALENTKEVIFTDISLANLLIELKNQPSKSNKGIWICGGASVVKQVLDLGLADELLVSVIPIILGAGVRLFAEQESKRLKLKGTHSYNGIVDLVYSFY